MAAPHPEAPRRLAPDDRRRQLTEIAYGMVAAAGSDQVSLDEIAKRAGVTRNLLYHYFPRGRRDLLLAAVDRSGEDLTRDFITDPGVPLDQRLARNFARFFDHAVEQTDAWRILMMTRSSPDEEVRGLAGVYREKIISGVAMNHFGTAEPPELGRIALESFLAYSEHALDAWRGSDIPRQQILELLGRTLVATVAAAKEAGLRG